MPCSEQGPAADGGNPGVFGAACSKRKNQHRGNHLPNSSQAADLVSYDMLSIED